MKAESSFETSINLQALGVPSSLQDDDYKRKRQHAAYTQHTHSTHTACSIHTHTHKPTNQLFTNTMSELINNHIIWHSKLLLLFVCFSYACFSFCLCLFFLLSSSSALADNVAVDASISNLNSKLISPLFMHNLLSLLLNAMCCFCFFLHCSLYGY